jgi:hypothetical protein
MTIIMHMITVTIMNTTVTAIPMTTIMNLIPTRMTTDRRK